MYATVCLLRAGQPKCAGDAAKSWEFLGEFSWVEYDPKGIKGLYADEILVQTDLRFIICFHHI